MAKTIKIKNVGSCAELHRDPRTGIAWVKDCSTGMGHSCHANIDATGSVRGMKNLDTGAKMTEPQRVMVLFTTLTHLL